MLSYLLTNRKAKKNSKNRHFFGSWGGSLRKNIKDNDVITREGSYGDVFYIILEGQVEVTKKQVGFIRSLSGGEYFGEKALLNEASIR